MKPTFFHVFYSNRTFFKRFSLLIGLGLTVLAGGIWGCGSNLATGGINLPAPTADLEGGTSSLAIVCGNIPNAPQGAIIQIINLSDRAIPPLNQALDANNNFSLLACAEVNQALSLQVLDQNLSAISEVQQITRTGTEPPDLCPTPSNQGPTCP